MFIIPIRELDGIVNDHFGSGDAQTQSINYLAELQEQLRADDEERDDLRWVISLLFMAPDREKQTLLPVILLESSTDLQNTLDVYASYYKIWKLEIKSSKIIFFNFFLKAGYPTVFLLLMVFL